MTTQTPRSPWFPVLGAALFFALTTQAMASTPDPRITTLEEDHIVAMISVVLLDEIQSEVMQALALNEDVARRGSAMQRGNPLVNVARAESRQAQNLLALLNARGLTAPVVPWFTTEVEVYGTRAEACQSAAEAERKNIWLYSDFLAHDLPSDVRRVFEQNLRVSLENHLPALERCSTR
jgi:hypothetical protein